jgi:hypothetical protein
MVRASKSIRGNRDLSHNTSRRRDLRVMHFAVESSFPIGISFFVECPKVERDSRSRLQLWPHQQSVKCSADSLGGVKFARPGTGFEGVVFDYIRRGCRALSVWRPSCPEAPTTMKLDSVRPQHEHASDRGGSRGGCCGRGPNDDARIPCPVFVVGAGSGAVESLWRPVAGRVPD